MATKQQNSHGGPIERDAAERLFESFAQIKRRTSQNIKQALEFDEPAIRFFCGREDTEPGTEDIAYVFDRNAILELATMVTKGSVSGLIVFPGARNKTHNPSENVDGRPTVMLFPFSYDGPEDQENRDLLIDLDKGTEHPGTFSLTDFSDELPERIEASINPLVIHEPKIRPNGN